MKNQLWKQGMRLCYVCKKVKKLDKSNFYPSSSQSLGFRYDCRVCGAAKLKSMKRRGRSSFVELLGSKCYRCGITNVNPTFFDIDHIKPIRQGRGRRHYSMGQLSNYMLLCPNCHRLKTIAENGFM